MSHNPNPTLLDILFILANSLLVYINYVGGGVVLVWTTARFCKCLRLWIDFRCWENVWGAIVGVALTQERNITGAQKLEYNPEVLHGQPVLDFP